MGIEHIVLRKGMYCLYGDYAEKQLLATLTKDETGEIVGYNEDRLLCLKGNALRVLDLRGEVMETFHPYTNPCPMRIAFTVGEMNDAITVHNADEEALWRDVIRRSREMPGQSTEAKMKGMLEQMNEAGATEGLVFLYQSCQKDIHRFVEEALKIYPLLEGRKGQLRNLVLDLLKGYACIFKEH